MRTTKLLALQSTLFALAVLGMIASYCLFLTAERKFDTSLKWHEYAVPAVVLFFGIGAIGLLVSLLFLLLETAAFQISPRPSTWRALCAGVAAGAMPHMMMNAFLNATARPDAYVPLFYWNLEWAAWVGGGVVVSLVAIGFRSISPDRALPMTK
jgi:hypothetical protein